MELYLIIAVLAAVLICLVILLLQNRRIAQLEAQKQQFQQLQNQLQETQKGDAALPPKCSFSQP